MKLPPIVSPEEWKAAREELLVKEKEMTRARDALAAEPGVRLSLATHDRPAADLVVLDPHGLPHPLRNLDVLDGPDHRELGANPLAHLVDRRGLESQAAHRVGDALPPLAHAFVAAVVAALGLSDQ